MQKQNGSPPVSRRRALALGRWRRQFKTVTARTEMLEARRLLSAAYALVDLGTLGGAESEAEGINDNGDVVGQSDSASGPRAFLYHNGMMTDLGTLAGDSNSIANQINNAGQM